MKLTVQQTDLRNGLALVSHAVATRSTLPVLGNVALEANGAGLKLSAMNMELAITCQIAALIGKQGGVTLPASLLKEMISSLPKGEVGMELNARTQTVRVHSARTEAKIKGIALDEFPVMPTPPASPALVFPAADMLRLIGSVSHAAANDQSRPTLNGVFIRLRNGEIEAAATDGFRLAVRTLGSSSNSPASAIVPSDAMTALGRILQGREAEDVEMYLHESHPQVIFRLPGITVAAQRIEANYPDYSKIIPPSHTTQVAVESAALAKALRTVRLFADFVTLTVTPGEPPLVTVSATGPETGDSTGEVEALSITGGAIAMQVNAGYVLDAVAAIEAPEVTLQMTTPQRPLVIRPRDEDERNVQVIMPMSTK